MVHVRKVIIPAAGLGTRFLPYTKVIPKEMVPLGNKPAIQLIIEEGLQSGITEFLIVTNQNKHAILEHFAPDPALEKMLEEKGKIQLLQSIKEIQKKASFTYIEQSIPLGLGHAILLAQGSINDDYVGIILPDDIIISPQKPALKQLIEVSQKYKASVIAVKEVPHANVSSYGVIAIKKQLAEDLYEVERLVEKPRPEEAPSNLVLTGHYILSTRIFEALRGIKPGFGGELQLTDAIVRMMNTTNEKLYAYKIKGSQYDIGTPHGWLEAATAIGV